MKQRLSTIICSTLLLAFLLSSTSKAQTVVKLPFTTVTSSPNTGMDFTPWLNDADVTKQVQYVWTPANEVWADLTLPLQQHSIVTLLFLYDTEGTFADKPDSIYALNGTKKTLIAVFTGPQYLTWDSFQLKTPVQADAIVIRKFGNNIPQKVRIYGYSDVDPAKDANLSALTPSVGTISPVFNPFVQAYTEQVGNTTTSIKLTPTTHNTNATVTVNGKAVATGQASAAVPLVVGANNINVIVTSQDKTTTFAYTLVVFRAPSTVATLSGLSLSSGTLSPVFSTTGYSYKATVANSVTYVRVTPKATDATCVIKINGLITASGAASAIMPLNVGTNVITALITAQDKKTTKTYTITITRTPLPSTTLSALKLSTGTLSPTFKSTVVGYTASVANTVTGITLTPTATDAAAVIKVNTKAVTSGKASTTIPLALGANTISVVVTETGKTTVTYTLNVTRVPSVNDNLSAISLSAGAVIVPIFKATALTYTASVANTVTGITETPTAADATSVITVNGVVVASGKASASIPLVSGSNIISTVVTAQDGKTTQTYTVTVTRTPLANATLSGVTLSAGTLSPVFAATALSYTASVANTVTGITVTPTATDAAAVITVNNTTVASGTASASIPLKVGANAISVVVTETGAVTISYTITVTRAQSVNDNLSNLALSTGTLSQVFSASVLSYTATVPNATASITVTPTAADATATIKVNGTAVASGKASGSIALTPGSNTINTVVTAQDGKTTKTYTTTVTRTPLTSANLISLVLSSGTLSPVFNTSILKYSASVASSVSSLTITPTSNQGATILVAGNAVISGGASASVPLVAGVNTISVVVTSLDLLTTNTYVLTVTRAVENASLNSLALNTGTLTPSFNKTTYAYSASVAKTTTAIQLTPVLGDATSTIAINGSAAVNSSAATVSLPSDTTVINTVVTTQDGTLTKTYALTVIKITSGSGSTTTPPDTAGGSPPVDTTGSIVKIPIDPSRFYIMNNASNGLQGLFDGILTAGVNTGYGELFSTYDCYYPLVPGEAMDLRQIKFYSYQGGIATPMTVSVVDSAGNRTAIASYSGGVYQTWIGPYPGVSGFNLTKPVKNFRYIVLTYTSGFPNEMEFDGYYTAPADTTPVVRKAYPLSQYFGTNAFEWNIEDPNNPLVVSLSMLTAMRSFTQVRHYMDWGKIEPVQGHYCYNPVLSGGWNYDAFYQACQTNNMLVLGDIKTQPPWMESTWPAAQQDPENVPVMYGKDINDPNSYIEQAHVAFEYAARYGSNASVNSSLLSVDPTLLWTGEPINVVKKGLGLISYIECDNERDKWWKGVKAYQNCYQYAANLSAFYDGNKNTMGPGVGVKNADPNMQVVIGGLCSGDPTYVHGMVQWCIEHRGYKADGTVNLCWDVINYHFYSNDGVSGGNASVGVAPELSSTMSLAQGYLKIAHQYANDQPVWVTESGYDLNPGSPQRAPAIGSKTAQQVEGDWILRTSLLYARAGIQRVFFYEAQDDNPTVSIQYASSGLLNPDQTRRPATDYLYQTNKLFGNFNYVKTLNSNPIVDQYQDAGQQMYMLVVPDQVGRTATYSLNMGSADSAYVYNPKIGSNDMTVNKVKLSGGTLSVNVTETPTFVVPSGSTALALNVVKTATALTTNAATSLNTINVYPNPTAKLATVAFTNTSTSPVTIKVTDVNMNKTYKTYSFAKNGESFSNTIDVSNVPMGVCIIQVLQGDQSIMRKVIKTM